MLPLLVDHRLEAADRLDQSAQALQGMMDGLDRVIGALVGRRLSTVAPGVFAGQGQPIERPQYLERSAAKPTLGQWG